MHTLLPLTLFNEVRALTIHPRAVHLLRQAAVQSHLLLQKSRHTCKRSSIQTASVVKQTSRKKIGVTAALTQELTWTAKPQQRWRSLLHVAVAAAAAGAVVAVR
jgi:hypothetical protein